MTDKIRSRIMYIEAKPGLTGPARIGRVTFSKSSKRVYYRDQVFQRLPYPGFKSNHYDIATGEPVLDLRSEEKRRRSPLRGTRAGRD